MSLGLIKHRLPETSFEIKMTPLDKEGVIHFHYTYVFKLTLLDFRQRKWQELQISLSEIWKAAYMKAE